MLIVSCGPCEQVEGAGTDRSWPRALQPCRRRRACAAPPRCRSRTACWTCPCARSRGSGSAWSTRQGEAQGGGGLAVLLESRRLCTARTEAGRRHLRGGEGWWVSCCALVRVQLGSAHICRGAGRVSVRLVEGEEEEEARAHLTLRFLHGRQAWLEGVESALAGCASRGERARDGPCRGRASWEVRALLLMRTRASRAGRGGGGGGGRGGR